MMIEKGLIEEAREVLKIINPATADNLVDELLASGSKSEETSFKEFISGKYKLPILLAFLIAFFNQLSGINAIIYYAPRIFMETGMGASVALLSSVGIGVTNLIATLIGMFVIDRFGRKNLMYVCSFGYIITLTSITITFFTGAGSGTMLVPFLIFAFIASHAVGQGAVIWVFISEIFPNYVRSYGNSLGAGTLWVFAALIAATFPYVTGILGAGPTFAVFTIMTVFQLFFVWKMMPETKGKSLEELQTLFVK